MITLGIECSSRQGSVALLKDGAVLAEKTWIADRVRHNTIFDSLEELVADASIEYSDITLIAVGRGPGSFSGMRMSFAIAQALALPDKTEVRAVSSGAALARAVAQDGSTDIVVVGDARRGQVWIARFDGDTKLVEPWELIAYDAVSVAEGSVVVSPEAERMTKIFPEIGEPRFPHARDVAALAERQTDPEELEPLYMHPPVFVEPKYG